MASHYLIDYENVREAGVSYCRHADEGDIVYLIYTSNASKIGLDALAGMKAAVRVIKVAAGKQSLDMHLISILGFLIHKHGTGDRYLVISKDTGYDSVLKYWCAQGYKASRISSIEPGSKVQSSGSPVQKTNAHGNSQMPHEPAYRNDGESVSDAPAEDSASELHAVSPQNSSVDIADSQGNDENIISTPENSEVIGTSGNNSSRNSRSRRSRRSRSSARKQAATPQVADAHDEAASAAAEEAEKPDAMTPEADAVKSAAPEAAEEAVKPEIAVQEAAAVENTAEEPEQPAPAAEASEPEISPSEPETPEPKETSGEQRKRLNGRLLSILSKEKVDIKTAGQIASVAVKNAGTKDAKRTIYRTLLQKFGQKQGLSYYTLIKKEL